MRRALWLAVGGLACGADGSGAVAPAEVADAFRALHAPVYEVFSLGPDRDAVHAWLAGAFVGDALTTAYVEHWRALVRMRAEDTALVVTGVQYEDVAVLDVDDAGAVRVDATWLVQGVVSHQQHKHPRINRYRAIYTLVPTTDGWRIAEAHARDLARVASRVTVDDVLGEGPARSEDAGFMDPLEMIEGGLLGAPEPTDDGAAP